MSMSKIKIAFFTDCLIKNYDGALRTMYQIIDRIDTSRYEFLFITGDKPQCPFKHRVIEVPSLKLPFNNNYKVSMSFLANKRLEKILSEFKPDLIHLATPSPLGHFGLKHGKKHKIPIISIYHTHFLSYPEYYLEQSPFLLTMIKKYLKSMTQSFYNLCDVVYVPTKQMISDLSQVGVFSNHMKLWKRGVNHTLFSPQHRDQHYIRSLTGNNKKNLLFASRLVWEKNLKTLVRIYEALEKQNRPYNLIVAGTGHAKLKLEALMPQAIFVGHLSHAELGKLYASADVFVFPSISESYGNVVCEAMASGLPCVIANGGGTTEFITHGDNGYLCAPYDEQAYLNAITMIMENERLREQFINKGISVTKELNWKSLADTYFQDLTFLSQRRTALT